MPFLTFNTKTVALQTVRLLKYAIDLSQIMTTFMEINKFYILNMSKMWNYQQIPNILEVKRTFRLV